MAAVDPMSLGLRYKQQLQQSADVLRERSTTLKQVAESTVNEYKALLQAQREQLQPQAQALVDGYKASIQDVETPVSSGAAPFLLKSYLWAGVALFASAAARVVSGIFLYGLVGAVFDTWVSLVLTFGALPAAVFAQLRKVQMSEGEREQVVLLGSVAEGVMLGALFSNRYATIYGPPLFLLPVAVGLLAHFAGTKEQVAGNRRVFLGALLGGALAGYVVYGFVLNFNFSYILSTLILGAAAAADLQLKVASFQRGDSSPQLEQWKTVVILNTAGALAHLLTSGTKDQAAAAAADAQA